MFRRFVVVGLSLLAGLLLIQQVLADQSSPNSTSAMVSLGGGSLTPTLALTPTATLTPTAIPTAAPISLDNYLPIVVKAPPPPTATPAPIPTATPIPPTTIPPTPTLGTVNPSCDGAASSSPPNYPVAITNVNKAGNPETVTIRNTSNQPVDINNWWICSMTGNQRHAILSGTLAPGQTLVVVSQANGPIWNNTATDPAALYRRDGFQVGYRSQ
ncbi:lamin tail domain-containing protein [Herpetosiphon sp. NSE202]|uniref:lamin tail domain-containing protein n=1 Tax=Herpetosiphon sp. NSE202 TaxID=3351349 RepID=UPI0036350F0F